LGEKEQFKGCSIVICNSKIEYGIVNSETTAIIYSIYYLNYVWIATGGINGCKWTERDVCKILEGRKVVLFPDLN
jgi:hypothetical protein